MDNIDMEKLSKKRKQSTGYVQAEMNPRGEKLIKQINNDIDRAYHLGEATAFAMFFEFAENKYDLDNIITSLNQILKENPEFAKDVYTIRYEIGDRFK